MSDFTIDDNTIAKVLYVLDDREIYNDIRSYIGILVAEIFVDPDDPFYMWNVSTRWSMVFAGETVRLRFTARYTSASDWRIRNHSAYYNEPTLPPEPVRYHIPYYDYSISLETIDADREKEVVVVNTGTIDAYFRISVEYKFLASERVTHEDLVPMTVTVRSTDPTSIRKYGRRVMNLTWSEGATKTNMQSLVDYYKERYKEPVAKLPCILKGVNDTLRTQIITREISDRITVNYTNLGFNDDCFIDSITISDDVAGMPICKWGLTAMRDYEKLSLFTLDTSELDGPDILGS